MAFLLSLLDDRQIRIRNTAPYSTRVLLWAFSTFMNGQFFFLRYGTQPMNMSQAKGTVNLINVKDLKVKMAGGALVNLRGRLHTSRAKGGYNEVP
jgi:hypothetical protein